MTLLSGKTKANYVRTMFDHIAHRYDLMNTLMTLGQHQAWRRAAARLAQPPREGLALDLATGTGDFGAALRDVEPSCRVMGVDFAVEMMRRGQEKYDGSVAFVAGDMLSLPLGDSLVDCTVNGFVLRNVADVRGAFAEMYRVLKPGGRAVSLEITFPRTPVWREVFSIYFDRAVPVLGSMLSGQPEAYRYLPQSVHAFLSPEEVADLLRAVGFRDVFFQRWAMGTVAVYVGVK
jgi:demethylmenaquinone methyltransferase/2-methoxy-6-polyprenyl-1,4-benzoquinol methylase